MFSKILEYLENIKKYGLSKVKGPTFTKWSYDGHFVEGTLPNRKRPTGAHFVDFYPSYDLSKFKSTKNKILRKTHFKILFMFSFENFFHVFIHNLATQSPKIILKRILPDLWLNFKALVHQLPDRGGA